MRERYQTWADIERRASHLDSYLASGIQAARAKDAEAHAAALAAQDAEIARLRARVHEDVHLRAVVELYRSNPMEMAAALVRLRDAVSALRAGAEETNA